MRRRTAGCLVALAAFCSGCVFLRQPTAPMNVIAYPAPGGAADGLVVLLPGLGDGPQAFERHGFVARIQRSDPRLDVVAVDAHFGYYRSETIARRLFEDVVRPSGHTRVFVVGVSMGGLGAAALAMDYPRTVSGMILLAPYVGPDDLIADVRAAGGLATWTPPDHGTRRDPAERGFIELWRWYHEFAIAPDHRPFLLLGYGDGDRLRTGDELVGAVLPPDRHRVVTGGHDWRTWTLLFDSMSDMAFGAQSSTR